MPEICEVALTAQYLMTKLKNKYITGISILSGKYTHTNLPGINIIDENKPLQIKKIDSRGKFMWFELEGKKNVYILNNFGLTGEWSFYNDESDRIILDIETNPKNLKNNEDPEKINKIFKLHYSDSRNFGLLEITDDKSVLDNKINKLAPDILKDNLTQERFVDLVNKYLKKSAKRKDTPIVKALMKQDSKDGIVSGIGNYLSCEILYAAKISPHTTVGKLSEQQLISIFNSIKYLVKLCYVSNNTKYMDKLQDFVEDHKNGIKIGKYPNYYPDIVIKDDETMKFNVYGRKKDDYDNDVKRDIIDGPRGTYWVPTIQK